MLKEKRSLVLAANKLMDTFLIAASYAGAYCVKKYILPEPFRGLHPAPNYFNLLLMIVIIWYVSFSYFNVYASYRTQTFSQIFFHLVKAITTGMAILFLTIYSLKIVYVSRIMMGIFFLLNIGFLGISRWFAYRTLTYWREKGFNFRRVLIIGTKDRAKDVINTVTERSGSGFKIIGCLGLEQHEIGNEVIKGVKVIDSVDNMKKLLLQEVVDEVIFAMPLDWIKNVEKLMADVEEIGVATRIVPDWQIHRLMYRPGIARSRFDDFLGLPTLSLVTTPEENSDLLIKSTLDYALAAIIFASSLPLFIFIAAAIRLSSPGPLLYKQTRCGLNGRKFTVYKFRTMVIDADQKREQLEALNEVDGPVFKIKKDPRIIPFVGKILRKSGFDELPQLINVLKGEMSLVGPRPPIPAEVEKYDFWQRRRLSMKPGITCLWQCAPNRNDVCFEDWMNLDLNYIDNWSLKLDFKILLKTTWAVLSGGGR